MGNQRIGQGNDTGTEIFCEIDGQLIENGTCESYEYCAGPNTFEDAICGKSNLCTMKGIILICSGDVCWNSMFSIF